MSAPALHLYGFSAPVVNGDEVAVVANFGGTSATLSGSRELLCELSHRVLESCGRGVRLRRGRPRVSSSGSRVLKISEEKYLAVEAGLAVDDSHGRMTHLCAEHGVNVNSFVTWRRRHRT